jgi:hypothetical protein
MYMVLYLKAMHFPNYIQFSPVVNNYYIIPIFSAAVLHILYSK